MSHFFLFPGQGSQRPDMASDFYEHSAPARDILERTASLQGADFLDTLFRGGQDTLSDTRIAQVALLSAGVAIASAWTARRTLNWRARWTP